jgi:hypothetical protein
MSYFADLTPYTYTPENREGVLNIGWLDAAYPFERGETPKEFCEALRDLIEKPILKHRGFHICQFCSPEPGSSPPQHGNGQIRVMGQNHFWYAAPAMVHHYVVAHRYRPPLEFIDAVLNPLEVGKDAL